MRQIAWTLELPGNSSADTSFTFVIEPALEHVVAVHCTGWRISASTIPPKIKLDFSDLLGSGLPSTLYSRSLITSSGNPTIILNRGLLIAPNPNITFDTQEYQVPRLICSANVAENIRGLSLRVTDWDNQPVAWDAYLIVELMVTVDDTRTHYPRPDQLTAAQKSVLNGYFIESGKRPRV